MQLKSKQTLHLLIQGVGPQMENAFYGILEGHNFKIFFAYQCPPLRGFGCH